MEGNYCTLCEVVLTSEVHAKSHFNGKKHKKKAQYSRQQPAITGQNRSAAELRTNGDAAIGRSPPTSPRSDQSCEGFDGDSPLPRPNESGHHFYCEVCGKNFSGPAPMRQHMDSFAHEKQLKKIGRAAQKLAQLNKDMGTVRATGDSERSGSRFAISPPGYGEDSATQHGPTNMKEGALFQSGGCRPVNPGKSFAGGSSLLQNSPDALGTRPTVGYRYSWVGPRQFFPGKRDNPPLRHTLICMCKEILQEEISAVIPAIAEAIADAIHYTLLDRSKQQEDGDDRDDKSPGRDGGAAPSPRTEETGGSPPGGQAETTPDADRSGTSDNGSSQADSPNSSDTDEPTANPDRDQADKEAEFPGSQDSLNPRSTPATKSENERFAHYPPVSGERSRAENDLDGPGMSRQPEIQQALNFSNIEERRNNGTFVQVYGVDMQKDEDAEERKTYHIQISSAAGPEQSECGLKGALSEVHETVAEGFLSGGQPTEERFSSVTSQDLIDFQDSMSVEEDEFYSALSGETVIDGKAHAHVQIPPGPQLADSLKNVLGEILKELGDQAEDEHFDLAETGHGTRGQNGDDLAVRRGGPLNGGIY